MATVQEQHALFLSFQGRSLYQIYKDECATNKVKVNSLLVKSLHTDVNRFTETELVTGRENYIGPSGAMPILSLVQANLGLVRLDLRGAGIHDGVVSRLVEIAIDHPRLDTIHLDENPALSVVSGKRIMFLLHHNTNIVCITAENTHFGENVRKVISAVCARNDKAIRNYFRPCWGYMRSMFMSADAENEGKILTGNLLVSIPSPQAREHVRRCLEDKTRWYNVNAFMKALYPNYKSAEAIAERAKETKETHYETMLANRAGLAAALLAKKLTCASAHRIRITHGVISPANFEAALNGLGNGVVAVEVLWRSVFDAKLADSSCVLPQTSEQWNLTPTVIRALQTAFSGRASMTVSDMLLLKVATPHESLRMSRLRVDLCGNAIPLETSITWEEAVNVCNERCDVLRVNKLC